MVKRFVEIAVVLVCAFGLGYLVWGSRIEALTSEVGFLSDVVSHQSRQIQNLVASTQNSGAKVVSAQAVDCPPIAEPVAAQYKAEKERCVNDRQRLQHDLESCLFEKARLNRRTATGFTRPHITPRTGTATVEEFVEYPGRRSPD